MRGGVHCAVWPGHSDLQQVQYFEAPEAEALVRAKANGIILSDTEEAFLTGYEVGLARGKINARRIKP